MSPAADTVLSISRASVERTSFAVIFLVVTGIGWFGLGTPFVTILFSCLVLLYLGKICRKPLAIVAFAILVLLLFYLFIHFLGEAVRALPETARKSIPLIIEWAKTYGWSLPFTDSESLRIFAVDGLKEQMRELARFAELTTKEFVYVIIGLVAACGVFANGRLDAGGHSIVNNFYTGLAGALEVRFQRFFSSFHTVMGAQLIISAINTFFTGAFVVCLSLTGTPLPYSFVIVVITFMCGILPIIGNLISNTVIFAIALTQSPKMAISALVFLIVLHKFEYFLNSKIIGGRIKNPMWLTLLGLLVGERLMGIPGMILAPVVLHYIKTECALIAVQEPPAR